MSRAEGRRVAKMTTANSNDSNNTLQGADATPVALRADLPDEVGFYKLQDGIKGRDIQAGLYLDYVQDFEAEKIRAAIEGREQPTLGEVVPATVGTVLVPANYLFDNSVSSNPSMAQAAGLEVVLGDDETFNNADHLTSPVGTYPVDRTGVLGEDNGSYDPSTGGLVANVNKDDEDDDDDDTATGASTLTSTPPAGTQPVTGTTSGTNTTTTPKATS